ncbi:LuxR C-terminal-related transcriptional regulator [Caenibacillus caldisaponilyticus]|uniref:LuxR C-terminal-related transcriptional regulator n=1 Tax=Caenibacillus caldisaponilyticus TaxID=1674942 RepID=UPI0009883111|nr:LuxR C-terminal-related transcriptional regulator [Caenibacillus caldisaponilyticus]
MNKKQIADTLRDYKWMINEIQRQRKMLEEAGDGLTAQYGVEGSLPKPKGAPSDPVYREYLRREKKTKWVERLEQKVLFIQEYSKAITNEREKAVLECMLDGMSMIAISRHMGLSERHIFRIRDSIVDQMAEMAGMSGMSGKLFREKQCG